MNIKKSFKLGILALVASVFVSSCSEEDPVGLFKVTAEPLLDTCYMLPGTAPAAQIKKRLLFDITGYAVVIVLKPLKQQNLLWMQTMDV